MERAGTSSEANLRPARVRPTATPAAELEARELFAPIAGELKLVEDELSSVFRHEHPAIHRLLEHGSLLGGKRLRPALLLLVARACGPVVDGHVAMATALEMIHTASLVHDDVLDDADLRRHVPTMHTHWDIESSVLFGDYLLARAFELMGERVTPAALVSLARATREVCEGELKQIASRHDLELDAESYLAIIDGKTAALCRCATENGARLAGAPQEMIDRMSRFGSLLGRAFQIVDDLLDLEGEEQLTGKSVGRDYEMGKATLPLILARATAGNEQWTRFRESLVAGEITRSDLVAWINSHAGLEQTRAQAKDYLDAAAQMMDAFVGGQPAVECLTRLCRYVIQRQA